MPETATQRPKRAKHKKKKKKVRRWTIKQKKEAGARLKEMHKLKRFCDDLRILKREALQDLTINELIGILEDARAGLQADELESDPRVRFMPTCVEGIEVLKERLPDGAPVITIR